MGEEGGRLLLYVVTKKVSLGKIQNPKLKSAMQKADEEEKKSQDRKRPSAKIQTRK